MYDTGDFVNDYAVNESFKSSNALLCIIHKKDKKLIPELIKVNRQFIEQGSSIPVLI